MSAVVMPLRSQPDAVAAESASSLSDEHCFSLAAGLRELPGAWLAQRDEIGAGVVIMILVEAAHQDEEGFVVLRENGGFRLQHAHDSELADLGLYGTLSGVLRAVRRAARSVI